MKLTRQAIRAALVCISFLLISCGGGDPAKPTKEGSASTPDVSTPGKDGGSKDQSAKDGEPPRPTGPVVFVLEIEEENRDSLPTRLDEHDDDHEHQPPFQILAEQLFIPTDKPAADALGENALTVSPAGTALSRCQVFAVHAIHHGGKGRVGVDARYFAFDKMPAAVPVSAPAVGDRIEHDPAKGPLTQALMEIRLFPDNVKQIDVKDAGDGKITVSAGGESKTLAAGETVTLWSRDKMVDVRSRALTSDSVTKSDDLFDPAPPRIAGARQTIVDPVSFGGVQFATRMKVKFHGRFPITSTPPQPKLED